MGLLMSDTLLIDPMLDETLRLRDGLSEWVYTPDAARDGYEHEAVDQCRVNRCLSRGVVRRPGRRHPWGSWHPHDAACTTTAGSRTLKGEPS